jgi:hypothetical protein
VSLHHNPNPEGCSADFVCCVVRCSHCVWSRNFLLSLTGGSKA